MELVQILLPLADNTGMRFSADEFAAVRQELADMFGGVTAFSQAPAEGLWKQEDERTSRDEIVIFEVMLDRLDAQWWRDYRQELETRFRQDVIVIRAQTIELL